MYLIFPDAYDKVNDCVIQDRILSGRRQKHTAPGLWERGNATCAPDCPDMSASAAVRATAMRCESEQLSCGASPSNCRAAQVRPTASDAERAESFLHVRRLLFAATGVRHKKHLKGCLCPMQRCGCFVENINSVSETPGSGVGKAAEKNLSVIFLKNY